MKRPKIEDAKYWRNAQSEFDVDLFVGDINKYCDWLEGTNNSQEIQLEGQQIIINESDLKIKDLEKNIKILTNALQDGAMNEVIKQALK